MDSLQYRTDKILGNKDLSKLKILEIGPLNNPLVKRSDASVMYVDYATTEILKQHPYDSSINPNDIVDVDIVWSDKPLKDCVPKGKKFDTVVACHVIEHVPDVIGWLLDIHSVLKVGGSLGLAIPDRRFTFDYEKNESTIGEMFEAYLHRYRKPSVRQLFDHCFLSVKTDAQKAWAMGSRMAGLEKFSGEETLDLAQRQALEFVKSAKYYDSHCWMFTPTTFVERADVLHKMGLFPFKIEFFEPSVKGSFEFIVRLTAVDASDHKTISKSISHAKNILRWDENEKIYQEASEDPRIAELSKEIDELKLAVRREEERRVTLERSRALRVSQGVRKLLGMGHVKLGPQIR